MEDIEEHKLKKATRVFPINADKLNGRRDSLSLAVKAESRERRDSLLRAKPGIIGFDNPEPVQKTKTSNFALKVTEVNTESEEINKKENETEEEQAPFEEEVPTTAKTHHSPSIFAKKRKISSL